ASELVRHELAYQPNAVSRFDLSRCPGAAEFAPHEYQVCCSAAVSPALPAHRHLSGRHRQGSIFCCVCHEFVKHHSHCLDRDRAEHQLCSADRYVRLRGVRGELAVNEGAKSNTMPTPLTQQGMGSRHGMDSSVK